jgi:hypothetical protein
MLLMGTLMLAGKGALGWPPDFAAILPGPDPSPQTTTAGHVARIGYGMARTVAFLPSPGDLTVTWAASYALAASTAVVVAARMAWRSRFLGWDRPLIVAISLVVVPFAVVGSLYYPSDPERWLFLMPVFWLIIGLIWDRIPHESQRRPSRSTAISLLGIGVACLAAYNVRVGLVPEAIANRNLEGLKRLNEIVAEDDLVISPAGIKSSVYEFYTGDALPCENLTLTELMQTYPEERAAGQAALSRRIEEALDAERRVLVYDFIDEGYTRGRSFPWSYFDREYGPEDFLEVMDRYVVSPVFEVSGVCCGAYELMGQLE